MKKIKYLIITIGLMTFVSCTDDVILEGNDVATETDGGSNKFIIDGLALNNGEKWQANIETTEGVDKMLEIVNEINDESTLKNYHKTAKKLNKVKGKIINKCSMKGESHDNLHKWLMPLIKKIDKLKSADDVVSAENAFNEIKANLNIYHDYFE